MRILHLLTACVFFLINVTSANAQQITGGLKFGMTQTTFSGELSSEETDWKSVTGIAGGVTTEWYLYRGFSMVGELLYLRMGAKTRVSYNSRPGVLTSQSSYLSVPVLAQFRMETQGIMKPRFFLGGAALFALESAIIVESRTDRQIFIEEDDSIEFFDYGLVAGAAVDFHLIAQRFTLEARYYQGQNDVTKPNSETGTSTILNNRGWAIMAGVLF